ncbi:MAG: hypothetical protein HZA91_11220 [Verrucomicrobia bacterium]|nr:hypothetical protein [Verrucomicrobiota bacterium]
MKRIAVLWLAVTASLSGAEPVVPWEKARDVIGRRATVEGMIVATHKTGKVCNLNFSSNWRRDFSAVIFAGSFSKWPGDIEGPYRGQKVRITGTVTEYQGRPQIVVSEPSQIEIVKEPSAVAPLPANPPTPPVVATGTPAPPVPATPAPPAVSPGQAAAASAPAAPNVPVPIVPPMLSKEMVPFTVEVKRFTGAKQGSGVVTKTGGSFLQTVRLNATICNMSSALVGPLEGQWVIGLLNVSSSGGMKQQFFTGGEQQMELKPLEKKVVHSEDVTLAGMSSNLGMKSGQKLRGHFVRVFYQGRLVFEEANPPAMKAVAENYLAGK